MAGEPTPEWLRGQCYTIPSPWAVLTKRETMALLLLGQMRTTDEYRDAPVDDSAFDAVLLADALLAALAAPPREAASDGE